MLGAPVFRTALFGPWSGNALWTAARAVPSLDLCFADKKDLICAITGRQLVTFARASSGTYVDSAGVLQTAATDVPRFDHRITSTTTNLAIRSEEFDNATWVQTGLNAFGSGSVANAIAAPDGTVTGDLIEEDTSTGFHRVSQTLISGTISTGTYTASVYVKANQRSRAYISLDDNATGEVTAGFALLTQAFNITTAGSWSGSTASIEDVGDGWFRISLTSAKGDGSSALTLRVGIAQVSVTTISYTGNGTAGLYVWGAQLVRSDSNGQYVRTTAAAASVSTTESLGLLVEEQRSNTILQSNQFNTTWAPGTGNPTISLVTQTAPDGNVQSWKLVEGTTSGSQSLLQTNVSTSTGVSAYSVYVKAAGRFKVSLRETTTTGATVLFDVSSGTVVSAAGSGPPTGQITPAGNGWYRCTMFLTQASTANRNFRLFVVDDATTTATASFADRTGDGTSGIYLLGAQLEAGATASSYIPTTTAAATRNADLVSITGTAFSGWYSQSEGTLFSAFSIPTSSTTGGARVYSISNSGATTQAWLRLQGGTNRVYEVTDSSTQQAVLSAGAFSAGVLYRGAVALKTNDFGFSENGSTPTVDNSGTLGTVDRMGIGMDASGTAPLNGHIRRLVYWGQRLPNNVLQAITQ